MKLYLIRHAKPVDNTGDVGLGAEGGKQAEMLAILFRQLAPKRESLKIVSSNAQRARDTAMVICVAFNVPPEEIATFPAPIDSSPAAELTDRLMQRLRMFHSQGHQTVIVIGHWEYLSKGLAWLVGNDVMQFPPQGYGAVASLDCSETFDKATGRLEWFVIPHV